MKERPILFSSAMVSAILNGSKTQTRRVVKCGLPITAIGSAADWNHYKAHPMMGAPDIVLLGEDGRPFSILCPFGQPCDRLWVRETWGVISHAWNDDGEMIDWAPDRPATSIHEMPFGNGYYSGHVIYAADGKHEWAGDDEGGGEPRSAWKPSIHMPRVASRIALEITDVRVERLQDISEEDAQAEGADCLIFNNCTQWERDFLDMPLMENGNPYRNGFALLWESINGSGSWAANPWVWAVEFRRLTP